MFVHFSDPDEYGHSHGWMSPEYLRAVAASDRLPRDACSPRSTRAADAATTLVIVTADHGGHGKRHSDGHVTVDREIPWIVRGPGVGRGVDPRRHRRDRRYRGDRRSPRSACRRCPTCAAASRLTFTR